MTPLQTDMTHDTAPALPRINHVPRSAPLSWLQRGWQDLSATGFRGVFYGLVFTAMGVGVVWLYATRWQLTIGLISGFFLLGPFICTGLYALSQQRQRDVQISLPVSLTAWRSNLGSIAFFAVMLTFALIVWVRVSVVIFALTSHTEFATLQGVVFAIFSADNLGFLLVWSAVGLVFASLIFAISVVSIPLMMDRNTDTLVAVFTSARTLVSNPLPLALWAASIAALIGFSFALAFVPLLLTAPLLGHATWHAYRDLVAPDTDTR